jgi:hypothetical protein
MCEIQDVLGQRRRLDDAPDLDGTFFFDQLPDDMNQRWRELDTDD